MSDTEDYGIPGNETYSKSFNAGFEETEQPGHFDRSSYVGMNTKKERERVEDEDDEEDEDEDDEDEEEEDNRRKKGVKRVKVRMLLYSKCAFSVPSNQSSVATSGQQWKPSTMWKLLWMKMDVRSMSFPSSLPDESF